MPKTIFDNGRIRLIEENENVLNIKTGQISQLPPRPFQNKTSTVPFAPQKEQPPKETPEQKDQNLRKTAIQDEIKSLQSQGKKPEHIKEAMNLFVDNVFTEFGGQLKDIATGKTPLTREKTPEELQREEGAGKLVEGMKGAARGNYGSSEPSCHRNRRRNEKI